MEIVAALFVENIDFRQVAGPSTRIDITGAFFSTAVPAYPAQLTPHLVVLVRAPEDSDGNATLETVFVRADGTEAGRNGQSFFVDPGKFGYRPLRGALEPPGAGTNEAKSPNLGDRLVVTVPPHGPAEPRLTRSW